MGNVSSKGFIDRPRAPEAVTAVSGQLDSPHVHRRHIHAITLLAAPSSLGLELLLHDSTLIFGREGTNVSLSLSRLPLLLDQPDSSEIFLRVNLREAIA